jgi:hypothetical protein
MQATDDSLDHSHITMALTNSDRHYLDPPNMRGSNPLITTTGDPDLMPIVVKTVADKKKKNQDSVNIDNSLLSFCVAPFWEITQFFFPIAMISFPAIGWIG